MKLAESSGEVGEATEGSHRKGTLWTPLRQSLGGLPKLKPLEPGFGSNLEICSKDAPQLEGGNSNEARQGADAVAGFLREGFPIGQLMRTIHVHSSCVPFLFKERID